MKILEALLTENVRIFLKIFFRYLSTNLLFACFWFYMGISPFPFQKMNFPIPNQKSYDNLPNSAFWGWLSVESQPQNPELRNNPENFHPCSNKDEWSVIYYEGSQSTNFPLSLKIRGEGWGWGLFYKQYKLWMKIVLNFENILHRNIKRETISGRQD